VYASRQHSSNRAGGQAVVVVVVYGIATHRRARQSYSVLHSELRAA
jgi:hypothetical protein